jgi:hypothetical protein
VLPLQILAIQGAVAASQLPNVPLLTALNKRRELYPITASTLILLAVLIYPSSHFGIAGVAAAACFSWLVGSGASFYLVGRALGISPLYFLSIVRMPLLGAVLAVIPTIVVPGLLLERPTLSVAGVARLGIEGAAAAGLYLLWLLLTDPEILGAYRQLRGLLKRARRRGAPEAAPDVDAEAGIGLSV